METRVWHKRVRSGICREIWESLWERSTSEIMYTKCADRKKGIRKLSWRTTMEGWQRKKSNLVFCPPPPKNTEKNKQKKKILSEICPGNQEKREFYGGNSTLLSTEMRTSNIGKAKDEDVTQQFVSFSGTVDAEARQWIEAQIGMKKAEPMWLSSCSRSLAGQKEKNEGQAELLEDVLRIWAQRTKSRFIQHKTQHLIELCLYSPLWV